MAKFWMVWNPEGRSPVFRHSSLGEAEREAERLASNHEGATFVILESVSDCKATRVSWTTHEEIPF